MIMALLTTTLATNDQLLNTILELEKTTHRHRAMTKALFMDTYPAGIPLLRRIGAMTKNFVMWDKGHHSRPGSKISQGYVDAIASYADQSITRVIRGHQQEGAVEDQDTGEIHLLHLPG
jgi:hypothetical protein